MDRIKEKKDSEKYIYKKKKDIRNRIHEYSGLLLIGTLSGNGSFRLGRIQKCSKGHGGGGGEVIVKSMACIPINPTLGPMTSNDSLIRGLASDQAGHTQRTTVHT